MRSLIAVIIIVCLELAMEGSERSAVSQLTLEGPTVRDLGDGWVEAIGEAYLTNITPEEAKRRALENARQEAIRYVVGVRISSVTHARQIGLYNSTGDQEELQESFATICEQTCSGKIVEERAPRWRTYTIADPKSPLPITVYRVYLRAKVVREEGKTDPTFNMGVKLNKDVFQDGDEITMRIWASEDCYLTVLNIAANDTVYVLLPHEYRRDNFILGGRAIEVPNAEERAIGIHYRVHLPEGQEVATEFIKIIATRNFYEFGKSLKKVGGFPFVPTPRGALVELQRWLVRIPIDERAEAMAVYEIRRSP